MELRIEYGEYANGRTSVRLLCEDGEAYATLSVNMPEAKVGPREFVMKDYSENEPVARAIKLERVFEFTGREAGSGYVICPIYRVPSPAPRSFSWRP